MFPWGSDYYPHEHQMEPWRHPSIAGNPDSWGTLFREASPYNWMRNWMPSMPSMPHPHMPHMGQWFQHPLESMHHAWDNMYKTFSSEMNASSSRPTNMLESFSLANPVRTDADGNRFLSLNFDMKSFKPEEINVTFNSKERCVTIEASHEVKESKEHYVKRHYTRKFYLPDSIKDDLSKLEIKSRLLANGNLCVEAQLPKVGDAFDEDTPYLMHLLKLYKMALTGPTGYPAPTEVNNNVKVNVKVI